MWCVSLSWSVGVALDIWLSKKERDLLKYIERDRVNAEAGAK